MRETNIEPTLSQLIITHDSHASLSEFIAPKIHIFMINPAKICEVVGKGEVMIDKIIEPSLCVNVDYNDDERIVICDSDSVKIAKVEWLMLRYCGGSPTQSSPHRYCRENRNLRYFCQFAKKGILTPSRQDALTPAMSQYRKSV